MNRALSGGGGSLGCGAPAQLWLNLVSKSRRDNEFSSSQLFSSLLPLFLFCK